MAAENVPFVADENVPPRGGDEPQAVVVFSSSAG